MKKILFSLLAVVFSFSPILKSEGYIATYSFELAAQDVQEYATALDNLMQSDWGKSFPGMVTFGSYVFNGYDDATHAVVINYNSDQEMGDGTESFYTPEFAAFLESVSDIVEPVEQSLNRKLISGGNNDSALNQIYTIYRMSVSNAKSYASAWSELTEAQVKAGNLPGSYGLRAQVLGNNRFYTHYAYTSASDIESAVTGNSNLLSSDSFKKFSRKVTGNREIVQTSMMKVLQAYNQ